MPTFRDLAGPMDVARFLLWVCAIVALGKVLFRSFWSDSLHAKIQGRGDRFQRIDLLTWELNHKRRAQERPGDPLSASPDLMPAELAQRHAELETLKRGTFWQRVARYQQLCVFCHNLAASLIVGLVFARIGRDWLPTVGAYAVVATLIALRMAPASSGPSPHPGGHQHGESCPDCNKRR
jgi:hypothetical protein